jgi:hypothetical protein
VRPISRLAMFALLLFASASLLSQSIPDPHMSDAASPLYQRSAFAHGYLHGYEQGFHLADLDIQMGHLLPGVHVRRDTHERDAHYRAMYGDKTMFLAGFKSGMRAGYGDSIAGVPFRAVTEMRQASNGLAPAAAAGATQFDRGVYEGFLNGERQGAGDPHILSDFAGVTSSCLAQQSGKGETQQYCDGYTRGFQLGYDDGRTEMLTNQKAIETAQNGKGH